VRTVPATPDLIPFLLARMGPARAAAQQKIYGGRAEAEIAATIAASTMTWCGLDDIGVVTMGGVMPVADLPDTGFVWQYLTELGPHNRRPYVAQGRTMLALALQQYGRLTSLIEPDYPAALRHIRRLGFNVSPPLTINGAITCLCERTRP
jgi:hypothetical protein